MSSGVRALTFGGVYPPVRQSSVPSRAAVYSSVYGSIRDGSVESCTVGAEDSLRRVPYPFSFLLAYPSVAYNAAEEIFCPAVAVAAS